MFASHIARVRVLLGAALIALAQPVAPAFADAATSRAAYQRAQTRFDAGDLRAARVELLNALKENRDNIPARLLYSRVLLVRGKISSLPDFLPLLDLRTPIVPAALRNNAGIVGAALYAAESDA